MKPAIVLACLFGVLATLPPSAQAQWRRYGRGGVVQGPDGPLYDTRSPEWRMSGGNIFVYQQLMEEKLALRQQQIMARQNQLMIRQNQQKARKGSRSGPSANAGKKNGFAAAEKQAADTQPARRSKKSKAATAQASAVKASQAPASPAAKAKSHSEIDPGPSDRSPPD